MSLIPRPDFHHNRSSLFAFAAIAWMAAGAVSGGAALSNDPSAHSISVDGAFDGLATGEWSDVIPMNFFAANHASPVAVGTGNPATAGASAALYAAIGQAPGQAEPRLNLLFDSLLRSAFGGPLGTDGLIFATMKFPVHLPASVRAQFGITEDRSQVVVIFQNRAPQSGGGSAPLYDVWVDVDFDNSPDMPAADLGLVGAAGFGPSPLSATPHLLVELSLSLRIAPDFAAGGWLNPAGLGLNADTGLYDPSTTSWVAQSGIDGVSQLIPGGGGPVDLVETTRASISISPTAAVSVFAVPEPTGSALLLACLGVFAARRRK